MATFTLFDSFSEALADGVHDFSSDASCTVTVALTAAANAPDAATDTQLSDLTQIAYTNASSRVITGIGTTEASGTTTVTATDLTISASGGTVGPFRYLVVYDDDASNDNLIGYYDYGTDLTLQDGDSITLDFSTGLLTIG